jgi:zinc protease
MIAMFTKPRLCALLCVLLPAFTHAAPKKLLNIQHWQTKQGAQVYFVPAPELPMVDIKISFDAGSARDTNKLGLAYLTNALLKEGAGKWDADAVAQQFDDVGAQFSNTVDRDMAQLSLRTLNRPKLLHPAVAAFTAVLNNPAFPQRAFTRLRKNILLALAQQTQSPNAMANRLFFQALYNQAPYGHPVMGTKNGLNTITVKDIRQFYKKYYVARNAVIAIVGAINHEQAKTLAATLTESLPSGQAAQALPVPAHLKKAVDKTITFPSNQTHIRLGQVGITRQNRDYFPLYVGNHILGGGIFISRLHNQVREKRGLSYSVYSMFYPMAVNGPFVISLQTKNKQAKEALQVTKDTLSKFLKDGPTTQEVSLAKKNIIGGFPLRFASNRQIASALTTLGMYNLPLDYLDTFRDKIEQVTEDKIRHTFHHHVHIDKMALIRVGGKDQTPTTH